MSKLSPWYYNDSDPYVGDWLRNLIKGGMLPDGEVDGRSICDVAPSDLKGFGQVHLFAGIGGWPLTLKSAGLTMDGIWTGSCPCQPFSIAGKGDGESDSRHLWPEFKRLIYAKEPSVIFGEQVTGALGRKWLSGVRTDMEAIRYAFGAANLCAASIGAPHIRQRFFFAAERLANSKRKRWKGFWTERKLESCGREKQTCRYRSSDREGMDNGVYSHERWIPCFDKSWRRIESGAYPLVDGFPGRVDQLRAYGNALNPKLAKEFVSAYMDTL